MNQESYGTNHTEQLGRKLFHTETYDFILEKTEAEGRTGARILRISGESGEETLLLDYLWPAQLTVEVEAGNVLLREDGVLCWELHVTAHHVKGMAAQEMVCRTVDIVRKTRFAIAERHLKHLPHQTYPSTDGLQGPYGHP